jgi:hypothetical protein
MAEDVRLITVGCRFFYDDPLASLNRSRKWCLICANVMMLLFLSIGQGAQGDNKMTDQDLARRGAAMRVAIDEAYLKLEKTHALNPRKGNDVTQIVVQYIPLGTPFDAAEEILRNAGFKVGPRPGPNPTGNRPDRYSVVASIMPYAEKFPSRINVYVFLTPENPGAYRRGVAIIHASINMSSL